MAKKLLKKGDELCRGRPIPMSSQLIEEVKKIYKQYHLDQKKFYYPPPLIWATIFGLKDMVWGFIQCAKQTNTNLHTGETGEVQKFLWLREGYFNKTALDYAVEFNHVGIANLLLANASLECLLSERNLDGKLPVSMLNGPEHDEFLLAVLEAAKREKVDPQASILISIDDQQQEPKVYIECKMDSHSYPKPQKSEARKSLEELDDGKLESTPNKNTILHLVSTLGNVGYVKDILKKHPSLIYNRNFKGETPAYVAAMEGHVDILEIMFNHLKRKDDIELLLMRMTDKQTALHIAVKNHHIGVVFWLMKKIPQLANHVNDFEESPLYLAAERGYHAILELMWEMCNEKAFKGPNGLTALHAAVILGSQECIKLLLSVKRDLLCDQDKHGWTPFHCAVFHNNSLAAGALLRADNSFGYQPITLAGINTYAIHFAATKGYCEIMNVLIDECPGSTEIVDNKGRNILHVAIDNNQIEVIKFIFQHESLTILINERDDNGNTPVHLLMASDLEMSELVLDSRIDVNVLNNEKLSPLDMTSSDEKRKALLKGLKMVHGNEDLQSHGIPPEIFEIPRAKGKTILKMASTVVEKILIVVTLIATATFAAAFTVPGGFQSDEGSKQGTPFLLRKPAFIAFVISNTIAFSCSCSVLFGHMVLTVKHAVYDDKHVYDEGHVYDEEQEAERVFYVGARAAVMYVLTAIAMLTMAIAFVTGLYVVLMPSLGLAIFSCLMTFFIIVVTVVFPAKLIPFITY